MVAPVHADLRIVERGEASSQAVSTPVSTAIGDWVIAWVATGRSNAHVDDSGTWTEILNNTGGVPAGHSLWKKKATVGGADSTTWSKSGTISCWNISIHRITGGDATDPVDVVPTLNTSASTSATCPSETTLGDDRLILRLEAADASADALTTNDTNYPASTTGLYHRNNRQGDANADQIISGAAWHTQASEGATGTAVFALDLSETWYGVTLVLKGPGAGGLILPSKGRSFQHMMVR